MSISAGDLPFFCLFRTFRATWGVSDSFDYLHHHPLSRHFPRQKLAHLAVCELSLRSLSLSKQRRRASDHSCGIKKPSPLLLVAWEVIYKLLAAQQHQFVLPPGLGLNLKFSKYICNVMLECPEGNHLSMTNINSYSLLLNKISIKLHALFNSTFKYIFVSYCSWKISTENSRAKNPHHECNRRRDTK